MTEIGVKLCFRRKKDQQCFENYSNACRRWPKAVADRFIQRIEIIQAADSFAELCKISVLRVHELKGKLKGQWSLTIHEKWRLIFELERVDDDEAIRIIEISNHYGD